MKSIENLIKESGVNFNGATIVYQYSNEYDMHLLEVIPAEKLEEELIYNTVQNLIDQYIEVFPLESVYIVTADSRLKITSATYVFASETIQNTVENVNRLYSTNEILKPQKVKILEETVQRLDFKAAESTLLSGQYVGESTYAMAA